MKTIDKAEIAAQLRNMTEERLFGDKPWPSAYAASAFDNGDDFPDHEIVETFVEDGAQVRVFAFVMRRKIQTSFELEPFTRRQVVA